MGKYYSIHEFSGILEVKELMEEGDGANDKNN